MRLPRVVGIVLCHAFEVDPQTQRVALAGLFQARDFPDFPAAADPFIVYAALHDGSGEGTITLSVIRMRMEEEIYRFQRWITIPGRWQYVNLVVPVKGCRFPSPGRYSITLSFDDSVLASRYLDVYRR